MNHYTTKIQGTFQEYHIGRGRAACCVLTNLRSATYKFHPPVYFLASLPVDFHCRVISTCVREAMYERSHVSAKVQSRSTSRLISTLYILPLFYLRDYNLRVLTCVAKHASVEINITDRSHMEFLLRLFKFDGFSPKASHQALYKKILLSFIPLIPVTRPREHFISVADNRKSCRRSVSLAGASTAV